MLKSSRIQRLFNIELPIIQAPMAGTSSIELTTAVSNAGGLGSYGAAPLKPDALREVIKQIKGKTDKPFNMNLFAKATEHAKPGEPSTAFAELLSRFHQEKNLPETVQSEALFGPCDEQLDVLIDEQVPVISFHFGIEQTQVSKIKSAGLRIICSATSVEEALHLEALGVDAVIAQGTEAGGHRGHYLEPDAVPLVGTMALVPQIVDRIKIPVIAAGGIMDGRGIVACSALGADAVQLGTAFLGCTETPIASAWAQRLQNASAAQTMVTSAISGRPARGIKTRYIEEVEALDTTLQPYPWHYAMSASLRKAANSNNDPDFMVMWSGQGVGMFRQMPAADLIATLMKEAKAINAAL